MDQKVIAGVGNVYRAELLFRQRLNPWLPGAGLSSDAARRLWDDTAAMMSDGVRDGRIITTPPQYWDGRPGMGYGDGIAGGVPDGIRACSRTRFRNRRRRTSSTAARPGLPGLRHARGAHGAGGAETVLVPAVPAGLSGRLQLPAPDPSKLRAGARRA